MRKFSYAIFKPLIILLGVILVVQSCKKEEAKAPATTLATIISGKPELSLFKAALERSKLTIFTEGPGPFTVIAPTNAAFNAIGISSAADINALDSNMLVNLLTYHIIPATRSIIEIPRGPNAPITTQGGGTIYAAKYTNGDTYINGVKITSPDNIASNGFLHIVDRVLVLPTVTIFASLSANPNYSLFVQAINKGAASASFTATGPITVFAPNNAAMTAAGYDATAIAASTATVMANLVKYHIYNGRLFSSEFKASSLKTVQGTNIILSTSSTGTQVKGTNNASPIAISGTDLLTTNGVIHSINGVLKP